MIFDSPAPTTPLTISYVSLFPFFFSSVAFKTTAIASAITSVFVLVFFNHHLYTSHSHVLPFGPELSTGPEV